MIRKQQIWEQRIWEVRRGNYYNVSIITLNTNLPYSLLPTPYSLI
ncbi:MULTISPECIES: hypothetical protein [unclassified Moorena]|nr:MULTISPECIES: hypothetical protein [unclassified Moorena]